jgi:mRNA-degrading endonuclease toxin of MazEF toxin-antitoxin module
MPTLPPAVKRGELYFCEPDPQDTVGSEQEKDRPWVIISVSHLQRGNCVIGIPLSRQLSKANAHLIKIPHSELLVEPGETALDSVALTDQIRALDKTRFRKKHGKISERGLNSILLGVKRILGIV